MSFLVQAFFQVWSALINPQAVAQVSVPAEEKTALSGSLQVEVSEIGRISDDEEGSGIVPRQWVGAVSVREALSTERDQPNKYLDPS